MANIASSRGYKSSYRGSNAPGAFYQILTSDFGEPAPAAPALTYEAGSGSLATGTAFVKVTWITQEGVSLPSAAAAVAVSASTGAVSIAQPTVPTNGQTVIGWQVYSQGSATVHLNSAAASTSPAPTSISTNSGAVTGYPIADTTILLDVYGTGAVVPIYDASGIQTALPSVPANSVSSATGGYADYYFRVPNTGSLWKNYKMVDVARPDSVTETAGISVGFPWDCQSPLYPGATPGATTYTSVAVSEGTYFVMNGILFMCIVAGTTATTFIGAAAFAVSEGATVTDGSVTWLCYGRATLVHARFTNSTDAAAVPAAQQYDLMQF